MKNVFKEIGKDLNFMKYMIIGFFLVKLDSFINKILDLFILLVLNCWFCTEEFKQSVVFNRNTLLPLIIYILHIIRLLVISIFKFLI